MNTQRQNTRRLAPASRQWWAMPAAMLATVLALPVNAGIALPDKPLTSGVEVAPNILFLFDTSNSMWSGKMPNNPAVIYPQNYIGQVSNLVYTSNTLSYNPTVDYKTWFNQDGSNQTGGTSYSSVYAHQSNLTNSINLGDDTQCYDKAGGGGNEADAADWVCGGIQTYYAPKAGATNLADVNSFYRYQILSGGTDIIRSEWGATTRTGDSNVSLSPGSSGTVRNQTKTYTLNSTITAGKGLEFVINSDTTPGDKIYMYYRVYDPAGKVVCYGDVQGRQNEKCFTRAITNGSAKYTIDIWNKKAENADYSLTVSQFNTNRCGSESGWYARNWNNAGKNPDPLDNIVTNQGWINCTSALPIRDLSAGTTRADLAAELTNYATWASWHRTRWKIARAGAGEAFLTLGKDQRVGFRTIYAGLPWDNYKLDIPIATDEGRFTGTNRSKWYSYLYSAPGDLGTPTRIALDRAGAYFSDTSKEGPYGHYENGVAVPVEKQYSCRQNFTLLATDGYWNDELNHAWSSDYTYDNSAGDQDGTNGPTITAPDSSTYQYTPAPPFSDSAAGSPSYSNSLADVAMKYWKNDLNAGLANDVPSNSADPAFWQHMVTFAISIGLSGTRGWTSVAGVPANPDWPDSTNYASDPEESKERLDDLLHAAVNGHGEFVSAASPQDFTAALKAALAAIGQRQASQSSVATNSTTLRSDTLVFNARYKGSYWTGELLAYDVSQADGVSSPAKWSASVDYASGSRKVYTYNSSFPSATQLSDLEIAFGTGNETKIANYIKGDQSNEGSAVGDLRERQPLLGDIVNSSLEYVQDTNTVYVGANDGMLHAFDATDGKEVFAYVPGLLNMAELGKLSDRNYLHKFFVDGPVVSSPQSLTPGKNYLVGALGRGGNGLYALDVTDPDSFSGTDALWEINETTPDFTKMGKVLGKPVLGQVGSTPVAALVTGNGVNSSGDTAVLYVIDLKTGAKIAAIDTGVGDATHPNGLMSPTGVLGADGRTLEYAYAGDLLGNLWKFDLKTNTKQLLFTAGDGQGSQPITGGIAVAIDPATNKHWVYFGTGRFMTKTDADDQAAGTQAMYGLIDSLKDTDTTPPAKVAIGQLEEHKLTGTGTTRTADTHASALGSGKQGWYITLPGAGERIVQDAQVTSNVLVTASMMPTSSGCDVSGTGYINAIDAFSGTSTGSAFFDTNGDGVVDGTDSPAGSMDFGVGMPSTPILFPGRIVVGGSGENPDGPGSGATVSYSWNRVTWREIQED